MQKAQQCAHCHSLNELAEAAAIRYPTHKLSVVLHEQLRPAGKHSEILTLLDNAYRVVCTLTRCSFGQVTALYTDCVSDFQLSTCIKPYPSPIRMDFLSPDKLDQYSHSTLLYCYICQTKEASIYNKYEGLYRSSGLLCRLCDRDASGESAAKADLEPGRWLGHRVYPERCTQRRYDSEPPA